MVMYQLALDTVDNKSHKMFKTFEPMDTLIECLQLFQSKGLTLDKYVITKRVMIKVHTVDRVITFKLFNGSDKHIGYAYISEV